MRAEECLKNGQIDEAIGELQQAVRAKPADAKLRVFLFQLLCVMGRWEKAMTQLNVAAEMDPTNLLMAQVCRPALNCEALRAEIFAGKRLPLVMGEPEEWVGLLVQAAQMAAQDRFEDSAALRDRALEAAPAIAGTIDGQPFDWIADADNRLGPLLEAIVDGRYYWIPFTKIAQIQIDPPQDLRDVVWLPAHLTLTNGGRVIALLPARYPGSESHADPAIRLARKTEWTERPGGLFVGAGQRLLATNEGEHPLLQTRLVVLDQPGGRVAEEGAPAADAPAPAPEGDHG